MRETPEENEGLSREKLAAMRESAHAMENELHAQSAQEYRRTGKLSSPRLCERAVEYENYLLTIEKMERLLDELEQNEP